MSEHLTYTNPLATRYASCEMTALFTPQSRHGTWRRLWAALAREERALGLPITAEQVAELEAHLDDIDFQRAAQLEKELRHDVMAHIRTYGEAAPSAAGIIHLGATSCFVTDNGDLIHHKAACEILIARVSAVLSLLGAFAQKHAELPCLGWTHFQPAQLTTVGKRATLWAQDLLFDLRDLRDYAETLPFRGAKGTTGTQASFFELFGGDYACVRQLDQRLAQTFGFQRSIAVSGQTYTRKLDEKLMQILCGLASSGAKFASDFRLLMHLRELEEPFKEKQVGSSAMAYKRNPMRSERICSLARFVQAQQAVISQTAANQWLERTLDDSACRRIAIPEALMGADAILLIWHDILSGIAVYPTRIHARVMQELPFMATEKIIMETVKRGGDRQAAHEAIREHSMAVRERMDAGEGVNDLIARLKSDPVFAAIRREIDGWLAPERFVGAAPLQVCDFLKNELTPELEAVRRRYPAVEFVPLAV